MTPDPNLTTGTRAYSLVSLATEAETEAREKWLAAGRVYDENRTPENLAALIDARDELKTISQQAASARTVYKHNHLRRVVDDSDNTVAGSLSDAGFSQDGRF